MVTIMSKPSQGSIRVLDEKEPLLNHVVMNTNMVNARNGDNLSLTDVVKNKLRDVFPDYKCVEYVHCVLLRHFA